MRIKSFIYVIATAILTISTAFAADCGPSGNRFSGRAFILSANVLGSTITASDTGELPGRGGTKTVGIPLDVSILGVLTATADVATAQTSGSGETATSFAEVTGLDLTLVDLGVLGLGAIGVTADVIRADSSATCNASNIATASGSSEIANLVVAGIPIEVTGVPNQTVELDVLGLVTVTLVINEQTQTETVVNNKADITVNAVHVTVSAILLGTLADVIISSAKSDITCR